MHGNEVRPAGGNRTYRIQYWMEVEAEAKTWAQARGAQDPAGDAIRRADEVCAYWDAKPLAERPWDVDE